MSRDFTVSSEAPLEVQSSCRASTGESRDGPLYKVDGNGMLVEGTKAFYNGDLFQVTIKPGDQLYVQASLPKMFDSNNLYPVAEATELNRSIARLQEALSGIGIEAGLLESKLCRVDICRNIVTDFPLGRYRQALSELTFPTTNHTCWKQKNHRWKNGTRQLVCYDKGEETELDTDRLQRLEYRLVQSQGVKRHLGPRTPSGLSRDFSVVSKSYREAVRKLFPCAEDLPCAGEESEEPPRYEEGLQGNGSFESAFEAISEGGAKISGMIRALALRYLRSTGRYETFLAALRAESNRQSAHHHRNQFEEISDVADILSEEQGSSSQLMSELRRKLLA